jgi:NAD(P)-dependent dehydrogenase (short-subunit alcohol dehydrogenase family)
VTPVNNAGANWAAPLDAFPQDAVDKLVDLNLKAVFYMTQLCVLSGYFQIEIAGACRC